MICIVFFASGFREAKLPLPSPNIDGKRWGASPPHLFPYVFGTEIGTRDLYTIHAPAVRPESGGRFFVPPDPGRNPAGAGVVYKARVPTKGARQSLISGSGS